MIQEWVSVHVSANPQLGFRFTTEMKRGEEPWWLLAFNPRRVVWCFVVWTLLATLLPRPPPFPVTPLLTVFYCRPLNYVLASLWASVHHTSLQNCLLIPNLELMYTLRGSGSSSWPRLKLVFVGFINFVKLFNVSPSLSGFSAGKVSSNSP